MFTFACLIPGKMEVRVLLAVFLLFTVSLSVIEDIFDSFTIHMSSWCLSVFFFHGLNTDEYLLLNYSHSILLLLCNYVPKTLRAAATFSKTFVFLHENCCLLDFTAYTCSTFYISVSYGTYIWACICQNIPVPLYGGQTWPLCQMLRCRERVQFLGNSFHWKPQNRNRPKCDTLSSTPGGWDSWGWEQQTCVAQELSGCGQITTEAV